MAREVIIKPEVVDYLTELINVLYKEEYFGFFESSLEYVDKIIDFIFEIPQAKPKLTKKNRFGNYYCTYKPNKNTSWYIVFDVEDNIYLVKLITNNHSSYYPIYIKG
jgi:hypothetical protein